MGISEFFEEAVPTIPADVVWLSLNAEGRARAYRMLENGELKAEGRLLNTDGYATGDDRLEPFRELNREDWRDAATDNWLEGYDSSKPLKLRNDVSNQSYWEINIYNSPELRVLTNYDPPIGSIDEYDRAFMSEIKSKVGLKLFAVAAAALASGEVNATGKALARFLLDNDALWRRGLIDQRNLERHLAPLIKEFNNLTK